MKTQSAGYVSALSLFATFICLESNAVYADDQARFAMLDSGITRLINVSSSAFDDIRTLAYSPNGQLLVSSHSDSRITVAKPNNFNGGINVWGAQTLNHIGVLPGHEYGVTDVSFMPDGERLVSASEDHTIRLWDVHVLREISKIEDLKRFYYDVVVLPSGNEIITGGSDKIDTDRMKEIGSFWMALSEIKSESELPAMPEIELESDYFLQRRSIVTGEIIKKYVGHSDTVKEVELSPDGLTFATASLDGSIRIWDIESGDQVKTVYENEAGYGLIYGLSYSRDGRRLAYGSGRTLFISDVSSLEVIKTFDSPDAGVEFILGDAYLLAYNPGRFVIWDVESENTVIDAGRSELGGVISTHAVSPDGNTLALGFNGDKDVGEYLILLELKKGSKGTDLSGGM